MDSFMVSQKEVHIHVLAHYNHPSNIIYLVKELKVPLPQLTKQMPNIRNLKEA